MTDPTDLRATLSAPPLPPTRDLPLELLCVGPGQPLELLDTLGEGGMGIVYRARQHGLQRDVAVKALRQSAATPAARSGMIMEARLAGALDHPNVIPIHQLGADAQGTPIIVMKRVEGTPWSTQIAEELPPLAEGDAIDAAREDTLVRHIRILIDICNALAYAHSRQIVHRDLKPDNVMIGAFGEVYLLDWGVALDLSDEAATARDVMVGTPLYMAPEMLDGSPNVDPRTDVYLVGAVLHELLTGLPPHKAPTFHTAVMHAARSLPLVAPQLPTELVALRNAAMDREKDKRLGSVRELAEALEGWLSHRASTAISDEALAELDALEHYLDGDDVVPTEASRRFEVCRFGFRLAARQWSDNPSVPVGLQRGLERMIRFQLQAHNLDAAADLLAALPTPNPQLSELLDRARSERPQESHAPFLRLGPNGQLSYANQAAQPLLHAAGATEEVPHTWMLLANQALLQGHPTQLDLDVDELVFQLTFTASAAGGTQIFGADVTALRQAQQRTAVLARFPEEDLNPALRIDVVGVIEYANPAAAPLLAVWGARVGGPAPEPWREHFARARRSGRSQEMPLPIADRIFMVRITPVAEHDYIYVRAREDTQLSKAERRADDLSQAWALNPNPLLRLSSAGVVDRANEAAQPILKAWLTQAGRRIPGRWQGKLLGPQAEGGVVQTADGDYQLDPQPDASSAVVYVFGRRMGEG